MLGTRIAQRRVELRLSQKELANQAGISVTYLSELERNKRFPSARICVDIANTLHVPMDYLLQDISRGGRIYRLSEYSTQIAITSWTPRGKNLGHGWSRRIYP